MSLGMATAAQRHLDGVVAAAARDHGVSGESGARVSLSQLLHYCMAREPDKVFLINGSTGVHFTHGQLLALAVPLARGMRARRLSGQRVMLVVRAHERTIALCLALAFAGVEPFVADPLATKCELEHFMRLIAPRVVFCDANTQDVVEAAAEATDVPSVVKIHTDEILEFADGNEGNIEEFRVSDADPYDTVVMIPTSGTTGLPKVAPLHHAGLIQQIANVWAYHSQFPRPSERVMVLTTPQWVTFAVMFPSCVVFGVELLVTPERVSVDHVLHLLLTYKPTWTNIGPSFAKMLTKSPAHHFSSLKTILTVGSRLTPEIIAAFKKKLPPECILQDGYGMTEAQGLITLTDHSSPPGCNGFVTNLFYHKLVKEDGTIANIGEEGELYIKGNCIIKEYFKNESEWSTSFVDGWLRTGDAFTADAAGRLTYQRRVKFSFKHDDKLVSPEELEHLLATLPFVADCVVSDCARGPGAAIVRAAAEPNDEDARRAIDDLVKATLSDHKRLRGGVVFVQALPRSGSGKLLRAQSRDMLRRLTSDLDTEKE